MRDDIDLNDLISHRHAWRNAIAGMALAAAQNDESDGANEAYWRHELAVFDRTFSIFDGTPPVSDIPAELHSMLPTPDASNAYRLLIKDGFTLGGTPIHGWYWIAPTDESLTTEQMLAVGELMQHGFHGVAPTHA